MTRPEKAIHKKKVYEKGKRGKIRDWALWQAGPF